MKTLGLECRNVGSWMQSCVAIAFIKTKPVWQENMLDLLQSIGLQVLKTCAFMVVYFVFKFLGTPGRLNDLIMNDILQVKSVTYLVRYLRLEPWTN